jgi:hypothetical protein
MVTAGAWANVPRLETKTVRFEEFWEVFGATENATVDGKVFPLPPDVIVTPSPA